MKIEKLRGFQVRYCSFLDKYLRALELRYSNKAKMSKSTKYPNRSINYANLNLYET